ncbi:MAG: hypothetical protein L3J71_05050 [Victivallaceae bacterium]|nr:hypothetical protein [Victivallaceae bacterium]
MASSEQKRQQKLAKKRQRENNKKRDAARAKLKMTDAGMLDTALDFPINECFVENTLAQGMATITVSRKTTFGFKATAVFILDSFCLGVKNCFLRIVVNSESTPIRDSQEPWSPEDTKKLMLDGVAYAKLLGFLPHKDFKKSFRIFDGIDETRSVREFEFGSGGKPMFIAGPFDSPARCKEVIKTLNEHCGEGNSHFIMPSPDNMELDDALGRWAGSEVF